MQGRGLEGETMGSDGWRPCRSCAKAFSKLLDSVQSNRHCREPSVVHTGRVEMSQVQPLSRGKSLAKEMTTEENPKYGVREIIIMTT